MSNRLKPCPFCGGDVSITRMSDGGGQSYYIVTRGFGEYPCECRVFMESEFASSEEDGKRAMENLIKAWNRRVGDDKEGR